MLILPELRRGKKAWGSLNKQFEDHRSAQFQPSAEALGIRLLQ
jgi:hypothetical protein